VPPTLRLEYVGNACDLAVGPYHPNPRSVQTRRQRWQAARLQPVLTPAIERMRDRYWGRVRAATLAHSADWKHSSEFFGHGVIPRLPHTEPKGRYADRRRRVPAG
jgi:hypothetical protein